MRTSEGWRIVAAHVSLLGEVTIMRSPRGRRLDAFHKDQPPLSARSRPRAPGHIRAERYQARARSKLGNSTTTSPSASQPPSSESIDPPRTR